MHDKETCVCSLSGDAGVLIPLCVNASLVLASSARREEACDPLLRQIYGPDYLSNETELPFVVGYIFLLASGADRGKQTMQPLEEATRAWHG